MDFTIPPLGESVTEGVIVRWLVEDGAHVDAGQPVLELETEKATMELPSEVAGRVEIVKQVGARVRVGETVARVVEEAAAPATDVRRAPDAAAVPDVDARRERPAPAVPAAERTSRNGERRPAEDGATATRAAAPSRVAITGDADIERVPMTELRRTIASRLVAAQQTAAILTTFNEIDLGDLLAARARHREAFRARHGVDLGLMALFARATVLALRAVPVVNARIDGGDVVYHKRVHLGIAVSTRRGLVVPVVRDADGMTIAELERAIDDVARRARDAALAPDDLAGGTFTITNGGVFGSLLSTPLLNPPQSGILGMHKIEDRPVARAGQVIVRPMMYVALSYDHRLVDGEQAVTFLVRVKELLEDPVRLALDA